MKKIINKPENVVTEMLDGLAYVHSDLVHRVEGFDIIARNEQAAGQVGVTVRMHTENGFLVSACTERIAAKLTDALQGLGVTVYSQIPVLKDHSKFSE